MNRIILAKTAGFCFGVDRAVKMVRDELTLRKVATIGPIIHNMAVVDELRQLGARPVDLINDISNDEIAVIRSHGVGKSIYDELKKKGIEYIDATCPFVERIHKIVSEKSKDGYIILIAGDKNHPEVEGIVGNCHNKGVVIGNEDELSEFFKKNKKKFKKKVAFVVQTTYNIRIWDKCTKIAKELCPTLEIYDTICHATVNRQTEAADIAKVAEAMIVVGGVHSSNTVKLFDVCSQYCKSYHIENANGLSRVLLPRFGTIGITAGASTPAYIIEEVQKQMSEIINNLDEDFNFEEALELSFKKIYTGNRVKGYITAVNGSEAIVDVGTKHTGYIPLSELTDDPSLKPADVVTVGEEIDLIVVKINDQEGIVTLSKKRVDAMVGFDNVMKAKEDGSVLEGVVIGVVKGGILVSSDGAKVFIPGSQTAGRRDDKLEDLMKKTVKFKILDVNEQRGRAVGSIKAVSKEQRDATEKEFWDKVKPGDKFKGEVKSITNYGVFVDIGGVDGMVHISELSWNRIKHPSEVVAMGDILDVYVKDLDNEKNRISLGYKKVEENPWFKFSENHKIGDIVKAKIVSITPFGAFGEIEPGIDGLIHISQISDQRITNVKEVLKVGQEVEVKITDIDIEKKRISISMKAVNESVDVEPSEEDKA